MAAPKNIIMVVADSLRYDSVYTEQGAGVPYLEKNAVQFSNARSSGCWTLPGTCSMFTGMLPHQHGAATHSRWFKDEIPSLPEKLKLAGYKSIQVTANIVTTDIFNVSKGFDEVHKTWDLTEPNDQLLLRLALAFNRPRIRRMMRRPDFKVIEKIIEDLRHEIVWTQKTAHVAFEKAKQLIAENNAKGQPVFMFINLMEPHYPYHTADVFTLMNKSFRGKMHEWYILYHFISRTFLKKEKQVLSQADLDLLKSKQKLSWELIRDDVDNFCKEMHSEDDNLMVFCSDHGDNFGDQGWQYHFNNVTDGGNRVPLFWLDHENRQSGIKSHNVSSRFMYHDIIRASGLPTDEGTLMEEHDRNMPVLQSFWYDNEDKTLEKYKYNQFAFIEGDKRFVMRNGDWMYAPVSKNGMEPLFEYVQKDFNPLEELHLSAERKKYLTQSVADFSQFSNQIITKSESGNQEIKKNENWETNLSPILRSSEIV